MSKLATLESELAAGHPVTGAYSADSQAAADQLNAKTVSSTLAEMDNKTLLERTDAAEYTALSDTKKAQWLSLCGIAAVDPSHAGVVQIITDIFGGGSKTLASLVTKRSETISRAEQLGLGTVHAGTVQQARDLSR